MMDDSFCLEVQVAKARAEDLRQIAVCSRRLTTATAVCYPPAAACASSPQYNPRRIMDAELSVMQMLSALGIPEALSTLHSISAGFERLQIVKEFRSVCVPRNELEVFAHCTD